MLIISSFKLPFCWLNVEYDEHYLYRAIFSSTPLPSITTNLLSEQIAIEIEQYIAKRQHLFQLPLKPIGSEYQLKVWKALQAIPAGQALTYGQLAAMLHSSPRAIGQACKRNPLALFIPCHRVIGKENYGGFMGKEAALSYKISLLNHEQFQGNQGK